jgi:quercetin dioxygenase-like cupin family protein
MVIEEAFAELALKNHPVARILHKGDMFKAVIIAFKKGMVLREHKTHLPATITVIKGRVNYRKDDSITTIEEYDNFQIPIHETHSIEALEDSICLLIQG